MSRMATDCIVVRRTNYREADRILVLLSQDYGRLSALAKGARKIKSRLAGGLEPLCINHIEFVRGRGELVTIVSSRPLERFPRLESDYHRARIAGQLIRELNILIEEHTESDYYILTSQMLRSMAEQRYMAEYVEAWFRLRLLVLLGRQPDLIKDAQGNALQENRQYQLDIGSGTLIPLRQGPFASQQIKAWRVLETAPQLSALDHIQGLDEAASDTLDELRAFMSATSF